MSTALMPSAVIVLVLACSGPLQGQTNAEVNASVEFNFSNPGARSLGLGGAFVALADDATAALTNPAGLTSLRRPEISVEGRTWSFTNTFVDRGRAAGSPTNLGVDRIAGLIDGSRDNTTAGPSFLSFVLPGGRWAVAAYRLQLANYAADVETFGAFLFTASGGNPRLFPIQGDMRIRIVNYGSAGAVKLNQHVSIGAGVSASHFSMTSLTQRFGFVTGSPVPGGGFGAPLYTAANLANTQEQSGDAVRLAANAGLLIEAGDRVRVGASFRKGAAFPIAATYRERSSLVSEPTLVATEELHPRFHVPDVFGAGLVLRPQPNLTVSFEYDRVWYSQMAEDFAVFRDLTSFLPLTSFVPNPRDFLVDDANELRVGLEYVIGRSAHPVAVRFGLWKDPDHRLRFQEPAPETLDSALTGFGDTSTRVLFRRGEDAAHITAGAGIVLGQKWQIDGAFDGSTRSRTASVSAVIRF